jgi:hypothetical protein
MSTEYSLSMESDTFPWGAYPACGTPGLWLHPASHRSVFRDNCGKMREMLLDRVRILTAHKRPARVENHSFFSYS